MSTINLDKLEFPKAIAAQVGLKPARINFYKKQGLPFVGRKTTLRWVRCYLAKLAGVSSNN